MKIEFFKTHIIVTRETGDKKYYGVQNAAGESNLLYAIKNQLNKQGYDLIKKRMWKDGHMVDDTQQYLRARKPTGDPMKNISLYNDHWAINGVDEDFNAGSCRLEMQTDIFTKH